MARMSKATKIENATKLRDLAIDLVANHGQLTLVKVGAGTIQVMTYEDERFAILYDNKPSLMNLTGFMIDIWFNNAKKISVQWDNDGPIDVLAFKTGDWETVFKDIHAHTPAF
jgi:hypothetical protein